jgi:excisionase family DNA binding protein
VATKEVKKPAKAARRAPVRPEHYASAVVAGEKRGTGTMRIEEVAAYLDVNHRVVRKLVKDGAIPRLAGTRTILIPRHAFMKWLEDGPPVRKWPENGEDRTAA